MLRVLLSSYRNKRNLIHYFVLTYLDKVISFALPLSILLVLKDKSLYTMVEVAFSYAAITMISIELGLSNYLFWGYKEAESKGLFVEKARIFFRALLFFYCVICFVFAAYLHISNSVSLILYMIVMTRTLFTFFVNFNSNIYRLEDRPSKIYLITIIVNLSSFILLVLAYQFKWQNSAVFFLLPSVVLVLLVGGKFLVERSLFEFQEFRTFVKNALTFSWPIILNLLAMSFINNYAKIYAYGHLSESEMVQISYIMRIGLIIQLSHTAYASYFSKSLFMDISKRFNVKIFKQYSLVILFSILIVVVLIHFTNFLFDSYIQIPFNLSTVFFILYIVLWCFIGYLELYFGVMNKNRLILYYSIISSVVYVMLLKVFGDVDLLQLSIIMVVAGLLNIVLVLFGLRKLGLSGIAINLKRKE